MAHWLSTGRKSIAVETQPDGQHLLCSRMTRSSKPRSEAHSLLDHRAHEPREQQAPNYRNLAWSAMAELWSVPNRFASCYDRQSKDSRSSAPRRGGICVARCGCLESWRSSDLVLVCMVLLDESARGRWPSSAKNCSTEPCLKNATVFSRAARHSGTGVAAILCNWICRGLLPPAPPVAFRALDTARKMSRHSNGRGSDVRCGILRCDCWNRRSALCVGPDRESAAPEATSWIEVKVSGTQFAPRKIEMNICASVRKLCQCHQARRCLTSASRTALQPGKRDTKSERRREFQSRANNSAGTLECWTARTAEAIGSHLQIDSAPGRGTPHHSRNWLRTPNLFQCRLKPIRILVVDDHFMSAWPLRL